MQLAARTGAWAKASGAPLPYDAEVEYLESDGGQYIEIPFVPTNTSGFYIKCHSVYGTSNYNNRAIGTQNNGVRWLLSINVTSSLQSFYGFGNAIDFGRGFADKDIEVWLNYKNNRAFKVDETTKTDSLPTISSTNSNILVFGNNVNGSPYSEKFKGKIYSVEISEGSDIVYDLIFVRFTNSLGVSEGAMYDRVSGQLFRNAGTGAFIIGPDK